MVEKAEIATLFKIEQVGDGLEIIKPIKVIEGVYDKESYKFLGVDGKEYQHIEDTDSNNIGYANRVIVDYDDEAPDNSLENLDFRKIKKLENDSKPKYIRFTTEKDKIYKKEKHAPYIMIDKDSRKFDECMSEEENNRRDNLIEIDKTPEEIAEAIKKSIKGQDEAIKTISTCIWATYKGRSMTKKQMLIAGATGVGKTAIFKKIQKILDIPVIIFSVPGLSQAGYVGRNTDEILKQLFFECCEDVEMAENAIIILDEIDKIAFNKDITSADVSTMGVQNELLKMVEGYTRVIELDNGMNSFTIDTSKILFIASGAFQELYEKKKPSIGFSNEPSAEENPKIKLTTEKLVQYGLKRELIGRFPIKIQLNNLTKEIFREIILESEDSELLLHTQFLESLGVTISNLDEIIDIIIEDATSKEIGARGLVETISNLLTEVFYEVGNNPGKYNELILGRNILNNRQDYTLIESKNIKRVKTK